MPSSKGHFNAWSGCWCRTMISCYQHSIKTVLKVLRSTVTSPDVYRSLNFGLLSKWCVTNWWSYWLLYLRQMLVGLWIRKGEIMGFHVLWWQGMTNTTATTDCLSLHFVIPEFLQWIISTCHSIFLTWAPPFQYLFDLQIYTILSCETKGYFC